MRQKRKIAGAIRISHVRKNVPPYLQSFIMKKFRQIDKAQWPHSIKQKVKLVVYQAASNEERAIKLAQPKVRLPHALLVETYANTLFKEFNRFVASKNVEDFISKRKLALPGMGREWYGTKREIMKKILDILGSNPSIHDDKKRDVLNYLKKNREKLTNVQMHRVQHYAVGLAIEAM